MRIHICAVGRMRGGPEKTLVDEYLTRFERTGRSLGLSLGRMVEVEDRKGGGQTAETELLRASLPKRSVVCALDERGRALSSPEFADMIARSRDNGRGDLAFVIGGADGIAPELRGQADQSVSLGKMVWPHMLVRVMLAEQLYRAASILAGSPYHRV